MSYSTLMVHLELEQSNEARLRIAGDLAEQFDAKLIGIAACDPQPPYYADGALAQSFVETERAQVKKRMAQAEEQFRTVMAGRVREVEWRCAMQAPADYIARAARSADLVITGVNREGLLLDPLWRLDPSDLVMQCGRPVFVVPAEAEYLKLGNAVVAWKDTREARRAIADALPLLQKAKDVNVIEVIDESAERAPAQERVTDVAAWLGRHKVTAFGRVLHAVEEEEQVEKIWQYGADFVVAGAYGHTRLREWVFGGFTRTLLTRSRHCSLLSH